MLISIKSSFIYYNKAKENVELTDLFFEKINENTYICKKENIKLCLNEQELIIEKLAEISYKKIFSLNNSTKSSLTLNSTLIETKIITTFFKKYNDFIEIRAKEYSMSDEFLCFISIKLLLKEKNNNG
ncbi:hypothetical protein QQA45_01855 [Sneathia sanguinegens]|uniref:Uncharacterized protein n=1 Tax=Sneathia sanguinegens TaxID=40543 RepID=A0ABT7HIE8_9FUSO|nr:hypothetical protein [Sneathia sanguinegens]MDK9580263.1 hypothetical protein [Sneathia sanguinegens]